MSNDRLKRIASILAVLFCCAECSGEPSGPGTVPAASAIGSLAGSEEGGKAPFLYVGSHKLSKYALGSSEPLLTTKTNNSIDQPALALDAHANLFESNGNPSYGQLLVYDARNLKLVRTLDIGPFASLAVDRMGYVYAAYDSPVYVFAPGATRLIYTIHRGAESAQALAFDHFGNLYAANVQGRSVGVFAPTKQPGHMKWIRSIRDGVDKPDALAFGPSGDLYVANLPNKGRGSITVYPPNSSKPVRRITSGIDSPWQVAVDSKGRLCVTNNPYFGRSRGRGWLSVYAAGSVRPMRKVTEGIYTPTGLAIDPSDTIYVANPHYGATNGHVTVTVYTSGGTKLLRTITEGINGGLAILIGSP